MSKIPFVYHNKSRFVSVPKRTKKNCREADVLTILQKYSNKTKIQNYTYYYLTSILSRDWYLRLQHVKCSQSFNSKRSQSITSFSRLLKSLVTRLWRILPFKFAKIWIFNYWLWIKNYLTILSFIVFLYFCLSYIHEIRKFKISMDVEFFWDS